MNKKLIKKYIPLLASIVIVFSANTLSAVEPSANEQAITDFNKLLTQTPPFFIQTPFHGVTVSVQPTSPNKANFSQWVFPLQSGGNFADFLSHTSNIVFEVEGCPVSFTYPTAELLKTLASREQEKVILTQQAGDDVLVLEASFEKEAAKLARVKREQLLYSPNGSNPEARHFFGIDENISVDAYKLTNVSIKKSNPSTFKAYKYPSFHFGDENDQTLKNASIKVKLKNPAPVTQDIQPDNILTRIYTAVVNYMSGHPNTFLGNLQASSEIEIYVGDAIFKLPANKFLNDLSKEKDLDKDYVLTTKSGNYALEATATMRAYSPEQGNLPIKQYMLVGLKNFKAIEEGKTETITTWDAFFKNGIESALSNEDHAPLYSEVDNATVEIVDGEAPKAGVDIFSIFQKDHSAFKGFVSNSSKLKIIAHGKVFIFNDVLEKGQRTLATNGVNYEAQSLDGEATLFLSLRYSPKTIRIPDNDPWYTRTRHTRFYQLFKRKEVETNIIIVNSIEFKWIKEPLTPEQEAKKKSKDEADALLKNIETVLKQNRPLFKSNNLNQNTSLELLNGELDKQHADALADLIQKKNFLGFINNTSHLQITMQDEEFTLSPEEIAKALSSKPYTITNPNGASVEVEIRNEKTKVSIVTGKTYSLKFFPSTITTVEELETLAINVLNFTPSKETFAEEARVKAEKEAEKEQEAKEKKKQEEEAQKKAQLVEDIKTALKNNPPLLVSQGLQKQLADKENPMKVDLKNGGFDTEYSHLQHVIAKFKNNKSFQGYVGESAELEITFKNYTFKIPSTHILKSLDSSKELLLPVSAQEDKETTILVSLKSIKGNNTLIFDDCKYLLGYCYEGSNTSLDIDTIIIQAIFSFNSPKAEAEELKQKEEAAKLELEQKAKIAEFENNLKQAIPLFVAKNVKDKTIQGTIQVEILKSSSVEMANLQDEAGLELNGFFTDKQSALKITANGKEFTLIPLFDMDGNVVEKYHYPSNDGKATISITLEKRNQDIAIPTIKNSHVKADIVVITSIGKFEVVKSEESQSNPNTQAPADKLGTEVKSRKYVLVDPKLAHGSGEGYKLPSKSVVTVALSETLPSKPIEAEHGAEVISRISGKHAGAAPLGFAQGRELVVMIDGQIDKQRKFNLKTRSASIRTNQGNFHLYITPIWATFNMKPGSLAPAQEDVHMYMVTIK